MAFLQYRYYVYMQASLFLKILTPPGRLWCDYLDIIIFLLFLRNVLRQWDL